MITPTARILRLEENFQFGTFGAMLIGAQVFCSTLEPADLLNKSFVSSIPAQQYICERIIAPTFGETFQIMNVPDRENVLFHKGNIIDNTAGCVILGQYRDKLLQEKRALSNSGDTFKSFLDIMTGIDMFSLTIKEVY